MAAAVIQKDSLTKHQMVLHKYMRIASPVSQLFNGTELNASEFMNSREILVPDIRVDDYITDASIARVGVSHYEGSEFTGEWKNGMPPIEWRRYSTSRHRSFGYTVWDEQVQFSPFKNLPQEYLARKMSTTVLRDHDKYLLLAIILGRMTGKLVARTPADAVGPATADAHRIANTGNQADYKWVAEPGETSDNEIQPSFATIQGIVMDSADPLKTLTSQNILFSDNWFDDNYGKNRFLLLTSALEAVITDVLIEKGSYTEGGWKMYQDATIAGTVGSSYLGTLRGWNIIKVHPEFLPKVVVDVNNVVDPNPVWESPGVPESGKTLKQVHFLMAYKDSAQVHDFFADKRQQDGGVRGKFTEYVQDFSYDAWVIDQRSEGIVPGFLPADIDGSETEGGVDYTRVDTSFTRVADALAAARNQMGTSPSQYPASGPDTNLSKPEWFHSPYTGTTNLDNSLDFQETGDVAITVPPFAGDYPNADLLATIDAQNDVIDAQNDVLVSVTPAWEDAKALPLGTIRRFGSTGTLWEVTEVEGTGTTGATLPTITGLVVGDTVVDNAGANQVTWTRVI